MIPFSCLGRRFRPAVLTDVNSCYSICTPRYMSNVSSSVAEVPKTINVPALHESVGSESYLSRALESLTQKIMDTQLIDGSLTFLAVGIIPICFHLAIHVHTLMDRELRKKGERLKNEQKLAESAYMFNLIQKIGPIYEENIKIAELDQNYMTKMREYIFTMKGHEQKIAKIEAKKLWRFPPIIATYGIFFIFSKYMPDRTHFVSLMPEDSFLKNNAWFEDLFSNDPYLVLPLVMTCLCYSKFAYYLRYKNIEYKRYLFLKEYKIYLMPLVLSAFHFLPIHVLICSFISSLLTLVLTVGSRITGFSRVAKIKCYSFSDISSYEKFLSKTMIARSKAREASRKSYINPIYQPGKEVKLSNILKQMVAHAEEEMKSKRPKY